MSLDPQLTAHALLRPTEQPAVEFVPTWDGS
jgi:hypothetical protein